MNLPMNPDEIGKLVVDPEMKRGLTFQRGSRFTREQLIAIVGEAQRLLYNAGYIITKEDQ